MSAPLPAQRKMAPHLQNATFIVWIFFLVWTAFAFLVLPLNIGSEQVKAWIGDPARSSLAQTATSVLAQFDAIWIFLAALSTYFALITTEGLRLARRWSGVVLIIVTLFLLFANGSTIGKSAPLFFTTKLGVKLAGRIPLAAPLLGMTLFFGARYFLLFLFPKCREWQQRAPFLFAALLGALSGLALLNLAPVAFHQRFYWLWLENSHAVTISALAWGAVAFLLGLLIRGGTVEKPSPRPMIIFCAMNALFLLLNLMNTLRV